MAMRDEIFTVTDRWGDEIVLTRQDWDRITTKRRGVDAYVEHVRQTLERPNMVYEGRYEDSKVFYRKGLLDEDPLYKACYVATIVRYPAGASRLRSGLCTSRSTFRGNWGICFMPSSEREEGP